MIEILLFFIAASLLLYVLFGGADYGAGILELLPLPDETREKQKHLINQAMGPVWEANHMWLILLVVILFMGFPLVFTTLMTALHIPMIALLFGIVVRGCVFTFRHYDAVQDPTSQKLYSWLFAISSLWTSVWLGIIVASLGRGLITTDPREFHSAYIAPWWGLHPFVTGLFITSIFAFLASLYLIGETEDENLRKLFSKRGLIFNILVVVLGAAVFATSKWEGGTLLEEFIDHPLAIGSMAIATALFAVLWFFVRKHKTLIVRIVAAGQITLVLAGWFFVYAPDAMRTQQGPMSFFAAAAPEATLFQLVLALLIGSVFIFPSLYLLLRIFKFKPEQN